MKKIISLLLSLVMMVSVFAGVSVTANAAELGVWHKNGVGWWFSFEDGTYLQDEMAEIDGQTYYFNEEGYMITGWRFIDGYWYYFNASGYMQKNWQKINGKYYYFDDYTGEMQSDRFLEMYDELNSYYYVDANGVWIPNKWVKTNTGWLYLLGDGTFVEDESIFIDGKGYIFDENGYMLTGWQYDEFDGEIYWVYLSPSGAAVDKWQYIDGSWYYFDELIMIKGWATIDGSEFYFNQSGKMITGWQFIDNNWYYFNGAGYMQTGWQHIGGKDYYFYGNGKMAANTFIGNYYVDANGVWIP